MKTITITPRPMLGVAMITLSALMFAAGSASMKIVSDTSAVSGRTVAFARFLLGLILVGAYMWARRVPLKPKAPVFVVSRAVFNSIAVVLVFTSLQFTTVTNTNMLNMLYPVFVFAASPFFNHERSPLIVLLYLFTATAGTILVIGSSGGEFGFSRINVGDLMAFASALVAAVAIMSLREARKTDSVEVVLFFMSAIGSVATGLIMIPGFVMPTGIAAWGTAGAAFFSLAGQIFLTIGFRHVSAAGGAILSASRIGFAAAIGAVFFADPITAGTIVGGGLILLSLIGVARSRAAG